MNLLEHLDEEQTLPDLLQTWKNGILERLGLLEALQQLLTSAVESESRRREAFQWLVDNIGHYLTRLKNDENIKKSTEEVLKSIIQKVIVCEHQKHQFSLSRLILQFQQSKTGISLSYWLFQFLF